MRVLKRLINSQGGFTTQGGFTLIELLIVISIIGVLTTIAAVNFVGVRERARDSERKADLSQIQTALEFYRSDSATNMYPTVSTFNAIVCNQPFSNGTAVYIKYMPCDPSSNTRYSYNQTNGGFGYTLTTCLENEKDTNRGTATGTSPLCATGTISYSVENP